MVINLEKKFNDTSKMVYYEDLYDDRSSHGSYSISKNGQKIALFCEKSIQILKVSKIEEKPLYSLFYEFKLNPDLNEKVKEFTFSPKGGFFTVIISKEIKENIGKREVVKERITLELW